VAVADNATALVLRVLQPPSDEDLRKLREFAGRQALRIYLQTGGLASVSELPVAEVGSAVAPLRYGLPDFDLELEFTPTDFVQVNGAVNRALVARAVELLEPTAESAVLDLYCGLGNFTLALARSAGRVVGVEGEKSLVERARHNARHNSLANVEFHVSDLSKPAEVPAAWLRGPYTHILLDPPRVGAARDLLAAIARLAPERLLYVSCHPGSLARDLAILVHEYGFVAEAAGVVDMFPHTAHIESMALLTRP
jgi:23S rRNA (uracil1939-C5)-methyltransferase